MNIIYAVMVDTRVGDITDEAIGLYNGSLCFVTGRWNFGAWAIGPGAPYVSNPDLLPGSVEFDLDVFSTSLMPLSFEILGHTAINPPLNPVTGAPQRKWKAGVISRETLSPAEEMVDMSLGGGYTSMSGLDVYLANNLPGLPRPLFDYLRAQGVDLLRCVVKFFAVIDGEFHQWSEYQIRAIENQEHHVKLDTWNLANTIHKDTLKVQVNRTGFPEAPEESIGKWVPLVIGRVPSAKLLPLTGQVTFEPLFRRENTYFDSTYVAGPYSVPFLGVDKTVIDLYNSMDFVTNDPRLVGKHLKLLRAGEQMVDAKARRILSVEKTTKGVWEVIRLRIDKAFEFNGSTPNPPEYNPVALTGWWVVAYELSNFGAVSEGPVSDIFPPLQGSRDGELIDIEGRRIARFPNADGPFPYAGVTALPEGEFSEFSPADGFVVPARNPYRGTSTTSITALEHTMIQAGGGGIVSLPDNDQPRAGSQDLNQTAMMPVASGYPEANDLMPKVVTGVRNSAEYYARAAKVPVFGLSQLGYSIIHSGEVVIPLPRDLELADDEELAVAFDADFFGNFQGLPGQIGLRAWGTGFLLDNIGSAGSQQPVQIILGGSAHNGSDAIKMSGNGGSQVYSGLRMCGDFYYDGYGSGASAMDLKQGSVSLASLLRDKNALRTYSAIKVRLVYQFACLSTGYIPDVDPVFECGHKLYQVALFKKRDSYEGPKYSTVAGVTFPSSWGGRRTSGAPIIRMADAIEYLIRERDGAPERIDTASFDEAAWSRPEAFQIGRQIDEQKSTKDYILEIAQAGFMSIVPGRDGKLRLKRLDGYDVSPAVYDESVNIVKGSVGPAIMDGLDRVYTGLEIHYDQHPETGEYRSTLFIRRTNEETFPAQDVVVPGSTTPLWTLYAGGFSSYNNGKVIWNLFREGYLLAHRENVLKREIPWFQKNTRIQPAVDHALGNADAAEFMAFILGEWFAGPRMRYSFEVPVTEENAEALQLLNTVLFRDQMRTSGLFFYARVEQVTLDPAKNMLHVVVSRRLKDEGFSDTPEPLFIKEVVGGDIIKESVGGDIIKETVH